MDESAAQPEPRIISRLFSHPLASALFLFTIDLVALGIAQNVVMRDLNSEALQRWLIVPLFICALFWFMDHYRLRRPFFIELRDIVVAHLATGALLIPTALLVSGPALLEPGLMLLISACLLIALGRILGKLFLTQIDAWQQPTMVIGAGERSAIVARGITDDALLGLKLVGFLSPHPKDDADPPAKIDFDSTKIPVHDLFPLQLEKIEQLGCQTLIVCIDDLDQAVSPETLRQLQAHFNLLWVDYQSGMIKPSGRNGNPAALLRAIRNQRRRKERIVPFIQVGKRVADFLLAGAMLLLLSPLFLAISIAIKSSPGPAFYSQTRIGRQGKEFHCYKFRTMVVHAEQVLQELLARDPQAREAWERDFKLKNDPRITTIGHWLRKTSLDELPQLWNVLKGDMSLVGPRPVIAEELERYGELLPYYLSVRPGLTGLWQVSGRNDISYQSRIRLDAWYVQNSCFMYDLNLLLRTFAVLCNRRGAY